MNTNQNRNAISAGRPQTLGSVHGRHDMESHSRKNEGQPATPGIDETRDH